MVKISVFRRSLLVGVLAAAAVGASPALAAGGHKQPPSRIVSLSATATEDLFAVGAGKQVVAVDSTSQYPKNAPTSRRSRSTGPISS
jgi:iron complex transport system substrate-binding protein